MVPDDATIQVLFEPNELLNKNVYLACSKQYFNTPFFHRACKYIHEQEPKIFVEPSAMFATNAEWREAFPGYLESFNMCVVVTDDSYYIGKGAYMEIKYFLEKELPVYFFSNQNKFARFIPVTGVAIVDNDNWREYAQIIL